jgi:DNA polymerase-1
VQASAADWALVLLALLRSRLAAPAQLVFFQHDEVVVHCPAEQADEVVAAIEGAAVDATRLVFGRTEVSFPMTTAVASRYSDGK